MFRFTGRGIRPAATRKAPACDDRIALIEVAGLDELAAVQLDALRSHGRSLHSRDAGSVGDAAAALEWIVGELGLAAITQEHV